MILSAHSKNRLLHSFSLWDVDLEYSKNISDYLTNGWDPGSFYSAVLANDFVSAMASSHSGNRTATLKRLAVWIGNVMPGQAWGSYAAVKYWLELGDDQRRTILEQSNLIYSSKEEMWLILKDEPTSTPYPLAYE
jgi:hypothetical protein